MGYFVDDVAAAVAAESSSPSCHCRQDRCHCSKSQVHRSHHCHRSRGGNLLRRRRRGKTTQATTREEKFHRTTTTLLSCIAAAILSSLCSSSRGSVMANISSSSVLTFPDNKIDSAPFPASQQHHSQHKIMDLQHPILHSRQNEDWNNFHHHHHHFHNARSRKLNGLLPEAPPISPFRVGRVQSSSSASSSASSSSTSSTIQANDYIENSNDITSKNNTLGISSPSSSSIMNDIKHDELEASQNQLQPEQSQPYYFPASEYDRDPAIQYGSSLFSRAKNNNWSPTSNPNSNNNPSHASSKDDSDNIEITAWAPEDYPDPWTNPTLCSGGGASSFSTNAASSASASGVNGDLRRALLCDPDQVLDRDAFLSVTSKLRDFAQSFASPSSMMDITEGIAFGGGAAAEENSGKGAARETHEEEEEKEEDDKEHQQPPPGVVEVLNHIRLLAASDAVGGTFFATQSELQSMAKILGSGAGVDGSDEEQKIEIAIALVKKIDLPAILRADSYFYYSDQDDMVNDAAQYFARYIHDNWSRYLAREQNSSSVNIVLIFISTLDRICYISSGNRLAAVLPWWRLEHVVQDMKQDLQKRQIGDAILIAIEDLTSLLIGGPPSFRDRVNDFFQRFGIVILFTIFTFTFATLGECRESRRRILFADRRSRMNPRERENARLLQKVFRTKSCPICLEPFEPDVTIIDMEQSLEKRRQTHTRIDSYGIPLIGTDDKPIKLLRCGHIFDSTCWQMWVDSGQGNVLICPVCRQDVGASKREPATHNRGYTTRYGVVDEFVRAEEGRHSEQSSLFARMIANSAGPSMLLRPVTNTTRLNYNTIPTRTEPLPARVLIDRQLSAPTIMRLSMHSIHGESTAAEVDEVSGERTPFLSPVTSRNRVGNYY